MTRNGLEEECNARFRGPWTGLMKFSVIIPTFNRARYLGLAIDSVLAQHYKEFEVILVDDGSVDNTRNVAEAYGDRIVYIRQENRGVSSARNRGIRAAQGEWVAFLDSDDEWLPDYLKKHSELLTRYPSIVGSLMNSVSEGFDGKNTDTFAERKVYEILQGRKEMLISRPFRMVTDHSIMTLQSCTFRRDVLLSTRLFDEEITIAEDWDVVAQMALKGAFALCGEIHARIIHRQEQGVENLSAQFSRQGIRTRLAWARVFTRFLQGDPISTKERQALRRKFAANQRALGNLYIRIGAIRDARSAYWQAWSQDLSLRSSGRLALSYLPEGFTRAFLREEV
jgi:glycosyltransferase involved in cell wall biosynthesis